MARKPKRSVRNSGKRKAPGARAPGAGRAKRLPSGRYAWKGKARPFSKLPKAEQSRIRSARASKAAATRKRAAKVEIQRKTSRAAREWVERRTRKLGIENDGRYRTPADIVGAVPADVILAAREAQKAAHVAWVRQGKHGGGDALIIAESITEGLGAEIAAAMPQLWWYH